jgi:energy-coupling factor transporter ATP-binding protein EcfA2
MHTLEITIQRKSGEAWPVVVEYSSRASAVRIYHQGRLRLDRVALRAEPAPKEYGKALGRALFFDEVRTALREALGRHAEPLHVLLILEDDELRGDRWERLCCNPDDKDQWNFLGVSQRLPFALYLRSPVGRSFPPLIAADLRALLLAASPGPDGDYGLAPFDAGAVLDGLERALRDDIARDRLQTGGLPNQPPTLDLLCRRLTEGRYTILHVVCHGRVVDREPTLYLARSPGSGSGRPADTSSTLEPVPAERLVSRLREVGDRHLPQLVFLAACESAAAGADEALGGLAARLVREVGLPAVVAMTAQVSVATAQELAEGFYRCFRQHGEVDRALAEGRAGLAERPDVSVAALYTRLRGQPLFYPDRVEALTPVEIDHGLQRLRDSFAERAPVLQGRLEDQASALASAQGSEARDRILAALDGLCEEVLEIGFRELARGGTPGDYDPRCPFRGLYPFRAEDQEFFFGREELVESLRRRLAEDPFLALVGASGSGKSSLVLAGLVPALRAQTPGLELVYLKPAGDAAAALAAGVAQARGPRVVVVDQFEEFFTTGATPAQQNTFLEQFLALPNQGPVVLTLRADFLGECALHPRLREVVQRHLELVAPLTAGDMRAAMEKQARHVGLRFEADLSDRIFEQVQGEPGAMPLLQHALLELWKRRHGRLLRAEEYRTLGGVRQAVARTAEAFYETLAPEQRLRVRRIFEALTRVGEGRRDTRRRLSLEQLVPPGSTVKETLNLLKPLADARLIVTDTRKGIPGSAEEGGRDRVEVEVAHEALITSWDRLRGWLDEDRESLRLHDAVREAAVQWGRSKEDDDLVHRGRRLQQAQRLAEHPSIILRPPESAYLEACWRADGRRREAEDAVRREREWQLVEARIQIFPLAEGGYPVVLSVPGRAEFDPGFINPEALKKVIEQRQHLDGYMRALGEALFAPAALGDAFRNLLTVVRGHAGRLRLRLRVDSPKLQGFTWEAVRYPLDGEWHQLTAEGGISFSRDVPTRFRRHRVPARNGLLRLLVVIGPPDLRGPYRDSSDIDPGTALHRALDNRPEVEVTFLEHPWQFSGGSHPLDEELASGYDVLHFHCPTSEDGSNLILHAGPVPKDWLIDRIQGLASPPQLCFLAVENGMELAQKLAKVGGTDMVLASTAPSEVPIWNAFARAFYGDLLQHGIADRAVASARQQILELPDRFFPTLFSPRV